MKKFLLYFSFVLAAAVVVIGCKAKASSTEEAKVEVKKGVDNVAYKWGAMALDATASDTDRFKPRPTITSRYLGLIFTAIFDAWTAYDENATPVYTEGVEKRPASEQTERNKEIAISYAAYRAMSEYYFSDIPMFDKLMKELDLDPNDTSMDPTTAVGIGNLAAKAVIEARKNDGANQQYPHHIDCALGCFCVKSRCNNIGDEPRSTQKYDEANG